ncbi:hypothetical protein X560_0567 [Listeria fleischmannii 1991]|uniref:Uncharacterized protein n=1 Tax=Listeria fleischmannii 1991 TaxID=1430899 RepID=A0A0J8GHG4_9LIST|nr:hypothetical protein X560_0567 [Listeria fleischmannii 1991]
MTIFSRKITIYAQKNKGKRFLFLFMIKNRVSGEFFTIESLIVILFT